MEPTDLTAFGVIPLLLFLLLWVVVQSFLVWLAALIVGLPERSVGKALSAGCGIMVVLILLSTMKGMLPPLLLLPIAVLLPALWIQRVYASSIGRALLAYVLSVLLVFVGLAIASA